MMKIYDDEDTVECLGDREFPREAPDRSDEAYEQYRDNAGDCLRNDIKALLLRYEKTKGYYGGLNNREKLIQHMISELESMKVRK